MRSFNVIYWNPNKSKPEPYDIIPYLVKEYHYLKEKEVNPKTREKIINFIKDESRYRWWAKCQYEIIINQCPKNDKEVKWDIYKQIEMNLDVIAELLIESV